MIKNSSTRNYTTELDLTTSQAATILTEMTDSQPLSLSPLRSPQKSTTSDDEIPSSQPPAKRRKLSYAEYKPDLNRLTYLQTRKAKAQKSLSHLKDFQDKGTCPVGLQFRPKPHIRQDKDFQLAMRRICTEAEQKLLKPYYSPTGKKHPGGLAKHRKFEEPPTTGRESCEISTQQN